ncbi:chromosome transmission fidelity 1 [Babesia ovata]|uniref:Chromosome transmission fidelity 1 n=1 Tax=Babesia ovata TaxID=189622 RepID=A0A2H6KHC4_9APIC|nr:chromosome transmission fidelity 1 [Babesia ovata]GBE62396.1 chromosome transmission fidelity 1 [Babesia ovata]
MTASPEPEFKLPFEAYPSQKKFMQDAYTCFEESRFGLFESPTGSGKTIAILCSVLTWLRDNRVNDAISRLELKAEHGWFRLSGIQTLADDGVPAWVRRSMEAQLRSIAEEAITTEISHLTATRQLLRSDFIITDEGVRLRPGAKRGRDQDATSSNRSISDARPARRKIQIVICSRTFSQLNQYVKEFRRLGALGEHVKIGIAAGRNHTCVSPSVRAKCHTNEEFNERCRQVTCEYRQDVSPLVEASMCFPMDLEDLRAVGTGLCACPYYASAQSMAECDIILAPYVSVFNPSIRQHTGIATDGNVLIVDEAHNLVGAVTEAQSSVIHPKAMAALAQQCRSFRDKYRGEINGGDETIASIERVAGILSKCGKALSAATGSPRVFSIPGFMIEMGLDDTKFHEIVSFMVSGDFCRRLRALAERLWASKCKGVVASTDHSNRNPHLYAVYDFRHFVTTLLSASEHDRVLVTSEAGDETIEIFNLAADEQGLELVYDSSSREGGRELSALCRVVEAAASVTPNGILCFVSSYGFLKNFQVAFESSPERARVLQHKAVFFESQGALTDARWQSGTDKGGSVIADYSKQALGRGAVLFAVYGGSQSEGVDFADGLARLVILVGQPYPPEGIKLQLKREYFRAKAKQESLSRSQRDVYARLADDMKTIMCFKTVNQSIGRAMRHKGDYAAIVLLDARYKSAKTQRWLPAYVRQALSRDTKPSSAPNEVAGLKQNLALFYKSKNKQ